MLVTIMSWLLISMMLVATGLNLSAVIKRFLNYEVKTLSSIIMLGLVGATVYAEYFSIFYKLGRISVLIFACLFVGGG